MAPPRPTGDSWLGSRTARQRRKSVFVIFMAKVPKPPKLRPPPKSASQSSNTLLLTSRKLKAEFSTAMPPPES
eukprot:3294494-Pleurochrysis_carterae.AAC.8